MKKQIILLALFSCFIFITNSYSQQYKAALGARLGSPLSVSFKTFISESSALEVYGGTRSFGSGFADYRWWIVSGAYQVHKPLDLGDFTGLEYYFGAGASVYFWSFGEGFLTNESTTTFGAQGYAGLSYTFENIPINLTVDWVPTYFFNGYGSGFGADYGSLGIRYIFSK